MRRGVFFISWNMKWLKFGETSSDSGELLKWTEVSFYWQFVGSCRWLGENLKGLLDFGEGLELFLWQNIHKLHWNKVQYNQMTLLFCRYFCWYWRVKWQKWWQVWWIEWSDLSCVCAPILPSTSPQGHGAYYWAHYPFNRAFVCYTFSILHSFLTTSQYCFCLLYLLNTTLVWYTSLSSTLFVLVCVKPSQLYSQLNTYKRVRIAVI